MAGKNSNAHEIDYVLALVDDIAKVLAGKPPEIQGATLAELTARWLAGHNPDLRNDIARMHIRAIKQLTDENSKIIWGK